MEAIQVVGAGGIGCAVGYALKAAGVPVIFVDANPRKIKAGQRDGVEVVGHAPLTAEFRLFAHWQPPPGATVLQCTKCYDNAAVLSKLRSDVTLIPIQNGFDPSLAEQGHEFEGIASFVSECAPDRPRTRITREGDLHLGRLHARGPVARALPAALAPLWTATLFRVVPVADIEPFKYAKLMYNAAISPLAAAAGIDNGQLLSAPSARRLFFGLLQENHRILSAAGVKLGRIGPFHPRTVAWILGRKWLADGMAKAFEPSLRGTYCSMAGEIEKGRTEIDNYNGYLIRLAVRTGTPCPLNRAVYDLVTRMTVECVRPSPEAWQRLTAA